MTKKKSKSQELTMHFDSDQNSILHLSKDLLEEIHNKGLECRFEAVKNIFEGGLNPRGWRVYRRTIKSGEKEALLFGKSPDGYIRRGDLILVVKSKEAIARDEEVLRRKNEQLQDRVDNYKEHFSNENRSRYISGRIRGYED